MTDTALPLRDVLDVMDRADRLDNTLAPRLTPQQLLVQAALEAGASQSVDTLTQAAQEHLAHVTPGALVIPVTAHDFGWERPRNEADQIAFLQTPLSRLTRWTARTLGLHDPAHAVPTARDADTLGLASLGAGLGTAALGMILLWALPWGVGMPLAVVLTGGMAYLGFQMKARLEALATRLPVTPDPEFLRACMVCPHARHHLKACLTSAAPGFFQGDLTVLEQFVRRALEEGLHHAHPHALSAKEHIEIAALLAEAKSNTPD